MAAGHLPAAPEALGSPPLAGHHASVLAQAVPAAYCLSVPSALAECAVLHSRQRVFLAVRSPRAKAPSCCPRFAADRKLRGNAYPVLSLLSAGHGGYTRSQQTLNTAQLCPRALLWRPALPDRSYCGLS